MHRLTLKDWIPLLDVSTGIKVGFDQKVWKRILPHNAELGGVCTCNFSASRVANGAFQCHFGSLTKVWKFWSLKQLMVLMRQHDVWNCIHFLPRIDSPSECVIIPSPLTRLWSYYLPQKVSKMFQLSYKSWMLQICMFGSRKMVK